MPALRKEGTPGYAPSHGLYFFGFSYEADSFLRLLRLEGVVVPSLYQVGVIWPEVRMSEVHQPRGFLEGFVRYSRI
jgi:hypothetical protein